MFTLLCTRKLFGHLGSNPVVDEVEPTTRLGDWYANILFRRGGQVVLFVNERSLLPVLVPVSPANTLVTRFPLVMAEMLLRLGVPASTIEAERREIAEVRMGRPRVVRSSGR